MKNPYEICVVGLGYIGLPTASIFAARGKRVYGLEISEKVVATINSGCTHFDEPDLDVLVQAAVHGGNLKAGICPESAEVFILAVPTPFAHGRKNHEHIPEPDLSFIEKAVRSIASVVTDSVLIILESTSPVGTTEKVKAWLDEERMSRGLVPAPGVQYAHCPERILPGRMIKELVDNDRLCGGLTPEAGTRAKRLYRCFCQGEIFVTDARTAEMVKLAENASRDVQIAFANELGLVCEKLGLSVWEVIHLANHHPRVNILRPGPGVGGHCIAVDPWFIVHSAPEITPVMQAARRVNDGKPGKVVAKVNRWLEKHPGSSVACLGLAFKADVDDIRESPAMAIVTELANLGSCRRLFVHEPHLPALPETLRRPQVEWAGLPTALQKADLVLLLVDHKEYRELSKDILVGKEIIDTRGIWT